MHTPWKNLTDNTRKPIQKLYWLIGINVAIFLLAYIAASFYNSLSLPAYLPVLAAHFWTPITYMFVNGGFISTVFNLLWLYWMGKVFEDYLGSDRMVGVYLLGGFAGAVLFVATFNIIPLITHNALFMLNTVAGASASVLAIIVATATLLPDVEVRLFIWPVKLKWLVVIYAIFDLINLSATGYGVIVAHIGAGLFGFVYIKQLQKGNDWVDGIKKIFKKRSPLKVASKNLLRRSSNRPRQEEVDAILDKISKIGYESLNKEEKEILFRASKNDS